MGNIEENGIEIDGLDEIEVENTAYKGILEVANRRCNAICRNSD